jgi:cell division protein ZapE
MTGVLERYQGSLVAAGELRVDLDQAAAARRLAQLAHELEQGPRKGSVLWRLARRAPEAPRGLYMWGGVGRGKSMLMDLFFGCVRIERKRRVHFHEFMIEVHARIAEERKKEAGDPIPPVAKALAENLRLLAFDEMVINNTADAMILSRLFTAMMAEGLTVVATSNRPPDDLYKDGLQRDSFLPFIALLKDKLDVLPLERPDRLSPRPARHDGLRGWCRTAPPTPPPSPPPSSA